MDFFTWEKQTKSHNSGGERIILSGFWTIIRGICHI